MVLELLLDDAPGPAPLALALELGWATLPVPARTVAELTAETARAHPEALVLLPAAEYAALQERYYVLPDLAAGGRHGAAAVLVADHRLDEIDGPLVDLDGVSRTTECLARATLRKFYGIAGALWTGEGRPVTSDAANTEDAGRRTGDGRGGKRGRGPTPEGRDGAADGPAPAERPTIEVREGGEALHLLDEPGDAVVEDLGRAWFIMTGLPCVTHLLVMPRALVATEAPRAQALIDALPAALATVQARRDELRRELGNRLGVALDLLDEFYDDQFSTLSGDGQKAVVALFERGARGLDLPRVSRLALPPGAPSV